jgi:hypothetical protein
VVKDGAEPFEVESRKREREPFRERIADGVGMAEPLAFDDLDALAIFAGTER